MTRSDAINKLAIINLLFEDVADLIDDIYTDFESRTCESCKYNTHRQEFAHNCTSDAVFDYYEGDYLIPDDFGCNKYEAKQ